MPLRIGVYTDATDAGGHEEMLFTLLGEDINQGCTFVHFVPQENERYRNKLEKKRPDDEIQKIPRRWRRLDQFMQFLQLGRWYTVSRLLKNQKLDVLLIISGTIEACNLAIWLAPLLRIPSVCYLPMTTSRSQQKESTLTVFRDHFNQLIYRLPETFAVITKQQQRFLQEIAPTTHYIPNCLPDFKACIPFKSPSAGKVVIGFVGRVQDRQKNVSALPKISLELKRRKYAHIMRVIGNGPDLPNLIQNVTSLGLQKHFEFSDWINSKEEIYSQFDLLIIPSFFEGVPLVMLEAISFGIPVVASQIPGVDEWIPPQLLFDPHNASTAAEIIINGAWSTEKTWYEARMKADSELRPEPSRSKFIKMLVDTSKNAAL